MKQLKIKLILSFTRVSANEKKVKMELFDEIVVWIILNDDVWFIRRFDNKRLHIKKNVISFGYRDSTKSKI